MYFKNLTGAIDTAFIISLEELQLQVLDLDNNKLDGIIPVQFSALSSLKVLNLSNNELDGIIPESLVFLQGVSNMTT